jgi:tripartite-type tricarboxylate transporter receptor subunit TctC
VRLEEDTLMRKLALATALLAAVMVLACAAHSQTDYPNRPVMVIVPYGAGGVADVGMRILGEKLSSRLKQQFVIENRPSAGGIIAAQAVAGAAPDGYALFMTGNFSAIAVALFNSLPYNILTDFAAVSTAGYFDVLLVTRAGSPLHTVQDVVGAARTSPGKLNIGTINPGSTQNLAAELFVSTADIKAAIVPFRTSPDMAGAVVRGDVDVAFEFYAPLSGLFADSKLVALASTGTTRTAYLPDVPTVMESGIKDYEVSSWNGLAVPSATPKTVVATLSAAIQEVIPSPDLQERVRKLGMGMRASTPDAMAARMEADIAKYGAIVEAAGIPKHD